MFADAYRRFQKNAFLDSGTQTPGKDALERIAGVDDEASMDVSPVGFEIRVHPREWARHWSVSQECKQRLSVRPGLAIAPRGLLARPQPLVAQPACHPISFRTGKGRLGISGVIQRALVAAV